MTTRELVPAGRAQAELDRLTTAEGGQVQHRVEPPDTPRFIAQIEFDPQGEALPEDASVYLVVTTRHGDHAVSALSAWSSTGEVTLGSDSNFDRVADEHSWLKAIHSKKSNGSATADAMGINVPVSWGTVTFEAVLPDDVHSTSPDDLVVTMFAWGDHWTWAQRLSPAA